MQRFTLVGRGLCNAINFGRTPHAPREAGIACHAVAWRVTLALAAVAVCLACSGPALAASYSWNSTLTPDTWSLDTNWTPTSPAGGPSAAGDVATINTDIGATTTINLYNMLDAGTSVKTIGILNVGDTNSTNAFTIANGTGGGSLSFDNGGAGAQLNELFTAKSDTISAPISIVDAGGLTITNNANTAGNIFTISGGITGTGNLVLNSGSVGAITLSTASINNTGTITNAGTSTGTVTIGGSGGGVGSNVTGIAQNAANSALIVSGLLNVNSIGGTTLTSGGNALFTLSGGTIGFGNLTINANSTGNFTVSGTTVNHSGTLTNSGSGTGTVTVSAVIGANVSGVTQNSLTSVLALNAANTFTSGLTVKAGTVSTNTAAGFGDVTGTITLGDTVGTANATLLSTANALIHANPITVQSGSSGNTLSILGRTNSQTFSGNITLGNALTLANLTSGKTTTFSGQITGSSQITIGGNNAGTVAITGADASSFTGNLLVKGGTMLLNQAASTLTAASLTMGGTSTFNYGSPSGGGIQTLGALSFSGGEGTVQSTWNTNGTTTLTFASAARTTGATGNFVVSGGTNGSTNSIVLTGATVGALIDPGIFFAGGTANAAYAYYDSAGFVRGINYATPDTNAISVTGSAATLGAVTNENVQYSGSVATTSTSAINYGTTSFTVTSTAGMAIGNIINLANFPAGTTISNIVGSTLTLSAGATGTTTTGSTITAYNSISAQTNLTINTLNLSGTNNFLTLSAGQILTVNGILKTGNTASGPLTATGGTGGTGGIQPAGNSDLVVRTDQGTDSLTLTSNILRNGGTGTGGLVKSGAGTLRLSSGYANNLSGGLFLNGGTYAVSTDAALGATGGAIAFNGGGLKFDTAFNPDATRPITVNAGGGTITTTGAVTVGANLPGAGGLTVNTTSTVTLNGNITFAGGITQNNTGTVIYSGNNTFPGGIYLSNQGGHNVQLNGATAGGTGTISEVSGSYTGNMTVKLRSDTSATFSVAGVVFNTSNDYKNTSYSIIDVGPINAGNTNQTLTLNAVTSPADEDPSGSGFTINAVAGSNYTLGINTLTYTNSYVIANAPVVIGAFNWSNASQICPGLKGSVGGSIGKLTNTRNGSQGGLYVTGGTWTLTGANAYGAGAWTTNGSYQTTGGTQINGASTKLIINNDLALGTVPGSAVNNVGLTNGGTLQASTSFTLNTKRGISIGTTTGTTTDTGILDVASGQTLTYNGVIASTPGNTGTNSLTVTPSGGTLVLGGASTYNGTTTVSAGNLQVANTTGSATGAGPVNVNNSALLNGTGTISGAITLNNSATLGGTLTAGSTVTLNNSATLSGSPTINGAATINGTSILSPGNSNGTGAMTINNTLTLSPTAVANFYFSSNTTFNQVLGLTAAPNYGGTLNLYDGGSALSSLAYGQTFQLFSNTGVGVGGMTLGTTPLTTALAAENLKFTNLVNGAVSLTYISAPKTAPSYTLGLLASGSPTAIAHTGAQTSIASTITNTGGGLQSDSITFTGLGANDGGAGGIFAGPTGGTDAGTINYTEHQTTAGLTYANSTPGTYTLTSAVGTPSSPTPPVTLSGSPGQVTLHLYTGQSTWNGVATKTWGDYGSWDANGGVPGVYASNPTGDSATFGDTAAGPEIVSLSGANPSITTLTLNSTLTNYTIAQGTGGTLTMNGTGAAINVTGSHSISAPVALASNTTITTNNVADALAVPGALSGAGNLIIAGPGLVTLSGGNSYAGTTINSGATLQVGAGGNSGTLGTGAVDVEGTLNFNRSDTALNVAGNISGGGVLNQNGSGTTTLSGTNGYTGGTNVNNGILKLALTASQPTIGTIQVANGTTLAVAAGGTGWASGNIDTLRTATAPSGAAFAPGARLGIDVSAAVGSFTYNSNITDTNIGANALGLVKMGAGTLTLTANNTFSGGLYLDGGTCAITNDNSLGATGAGVTFNGGTLLLNCAGGGAGGANFTTSRPITINAGGASIDRPLYTNQGTNPYGTVMLAGNISGVGRLNANTPGGGGYAAFVLSGNNSSLSGGIYSNGNCYLTLIGGNSSGTGTIRFDGGYATDTLNLRSDTNNDTFVAPVVFSNAPYPYINVDRLPAGSGTNNTLKLNSVSVNSLGDQNNPGLRISGGNGYSLAIESLYLASNYPIYPSANVAIGTLTLGQPAWNGNIILGGTAPGNTIGSIVLAGGTSGTNAVNVASGTWALTGASTYTVPTLVSGGKLLVNGSLAAASAVTVNSGATLDGIGTINGAATVQLGGTLARTAVGTLTVGSLELKFGDGLSVSKGTLDFSALSASTPSVNVLGQLKLDDTVFTLTGTAPTVSSTYNLFGYGTLSTLFGVDRLSVDNYAAFGFTGYSFLDDPIAKLVKLTLTRSGIGAGSGTWTGAAVPTDNLWTNTANWSGGYPSAATHTATFNGAGQVAAIDLDGSKTVGKVELSSTGGAGTGYTLGSASTPNTLTLDNGPSTAAEIKAVSGTHFINAKVFGTASQTLNVIAETGGSLALTGGANNPATATLALSQSSTGTLAAGSVANAGTMTVSGTVAANAISGAGSTQVNASASLTADSIVQNTLSIGAGGVVTIRETTGGAVNAVPEPGTWVLIGTALMALLALRRRHRG